MAFDEEEKEEEEISIDFSKIKNIFRRKKKTEEVAEVKKEADKVGDAVKEDINKEEKLAKKVEKEKEVMQEVDVELEQEKKEAKDADKKVEQVDKHLEKTKQKVDTVAEMTEEDDEDIAIDFGKIKDKFKGIFKSDDTNKKEATSETSSVEKNEDDEELSFDFSKIKSGIKNLFKKGEGDETEKSDDDVSFDIAKAKDFYQKYKRYIIPTLLIIIALFFSISLRMMPASLPITDDWARDTVFNFYRNQVRGQINQQYPNLPDANKNNLVEQEFAKILQQNKQQIAQQIKATSFQFKAQLKDDQGYTYLLAIDPYFWYRLAGNVVDHGYVGDEKKNGVEYDTFMIAPLGRTMPSDMGHAYLEAYFFKFFRFFNRNLTLFGFAFFMPIIFASLAVIPAFFIARRLAGNFGGFIAAFLVAVHPAYLNRTAGGFSDTDAYNVTFPLLIMWLFLEAFYAKSFKKRIGYALGASFLTGLYSSIWLGWWFILDFITVASILYLIYYFLLHLSDFKKGFSSFIQRPLFKQSIFVILLFIVGSGIFVTIFQSFDVFWNGIFGPIWFTTLKQVGISSVWPNVFTTVAEQNEASLGTIISQVGGKLLFLVAMIGILFTLMRKDSMKAKDYIFLILSALWFLIILNINITHPIWFLFWLSLPILVKVALTIKEKDVDVDIKLATILVIWFVASVYASTKGIRFTLLLVPGFAIAVGIALGYFYNIGTKLMSKSLRLNERMVGTVFIVLLIFLFIYPVFTSAQRQARVEIPSMNDAWYRSLNKINLEAEPDAIINSWWDFGHWFKAIGNRRVTFDGASQGTPMAHWIGNSLLTSDEDINIGILRMMDCGSNTAFEKLDEVIDDTAKSVDILYEIIILDQLGAEEVLQSYRLTEEQVQSVIEYTHCTPPENYYITSQDMIGKSGVWAHFGSWNFERALQFNTLKKKEYRDDISLSVSYLQDMFNFSDSKARDRYYEIQAIRDDREANSWIAPWPSYASGVNPCETVNETLIKCSVGQGAFLDIDLETLEASIQTPQGLKHPNSLYFATNNSMIRKDFNDTLGLDITIWPTGENSYARLLSAHPLGGSMFTRLFFMEGHGLKHFEKFSDERTLTGGRVIVWKVDWDGNQNNTVDYYKPKPAEKEEDKTSEEQETVSENLTTSNRSEDVAKREEMIEQGESYSENITNTTDDPFQQEKEKNSSNINLTNETQ